MYRAVIYLLVAGILVCGAKYGWSRYHHAQPPESDQSADSGSHSTGSQDSEPSTSVAGPLAEFMNHIKPTQDDHTRKRVIVASDHVSDSPVGTGTAVLHKTFYLANTLDVPFQVPAHAASPHLLGTFRSYAQHAGEPASDMTANVDFLLLNEQQHADLLNGHPVEAVFSAEDAHDQEVNFLMPATFNQAASYFLVFRNSSPGKKVVHADFHVDF